MNSIVAKKGERQRYALIFHTYNFALAGRAFSLEIQSSTSF